MASLIRSLIVKKSNLLLRSTPVNCSALRNAGHWQYEHKPGPYPRTPEERAASAKRYGMLIEEYEPYPEELGFGDYPKLPDIGGDSKDPYYPWDGPEQRRNFKEVMHAKSELYGMDRYDPAKRSPIPIKEQWMWFLGTMTMFYIIFEIFENKDLRMQRPVMKKQYPTAGVVHYTFDPQ